ALSLEAASPLRYSARAGLLVELGRQTYDTLAKALREPILNSLDAGARRVHIDIDPSDTGSLEVRYDWPGLAVGDLCDRFMTIGGSARSFDGSKYGRIGIGSLALLGYGREITIETKRAGDDFAVVAELNPPRVSGTAERLTHLSDFVAGSARVVA